MLCAGWLDVTPTRCGARSWSLEQSTWIAGLRRMPSRRGWPPMQILSGSGPNLEEGYFARVDIDGGRSLWVYPRLFGEAIIAIGRTDHNGCYDDFWDYDT